MEKVPPRNKNRPKDAGLVKPEVLGSHLANLQDEELPGAFVGLASAITPEYAGRRPLMVLKTSEEDPVQVLHALI